MTMTELLKFHVYPPLATVFEFYKSKISCSSPENSEIASISQLIYQFDRFWLGVEQWEDCLYVTWTAATNWCNEHSGHDATKCVEVENINAWHAWRRGPTTTFGSCQRRYFTTLNNLWWIISTGSRCGLQERPLLMLNYTLILYWRAANQFCDQDVWSCQWKRM